MRSGREELELEPSMQCRVRQVRRLLVGAPYLLYCDTRYSTGHEVVGIASVQSSALWLLQGGLRQRCGTPPTLLAGDVRVVPLVVVPIGSIDGAKSNTTA